MPVEVQRTYLELTEPSDLSPAPPSDLGARVEQLDPVPPALYRQLYRAVGEQWHWRDRLDWTDERIARHVGRAEITVYVARVNDDIAGYFELEQHADGAVEIAYFGLLPPFFGRGLGGQLLTHAVKEAWRLGARRVWLHTCTLDSPRALPNYLARGFRAFKVESYLADVPTSAD